MLMYRRFHPEMLGILARRAAGFQEPHSFGNGREPMEGDRASSAYAAEFTSKRRGRSKPITAFNMLKLLHRTSTCFWMVLWDFMVFRYYNSMEPSFQDPCFWARKSTITQRRRHFCRKAQCDGTCFRLDALAPPWPPADAPDETDGLPEPPLKRRKMQSVTETDTESTDSSEAKGPTPKGAVAAVTNSKVTDQSHQERPPAPAPAAPAQPTVMSSMGHLVLDVTRMAAFSTAGTAWNGRCYGKGVRL